MLNGIRRLDDAMNRFLPPLVLVLVLVLTACQTALQTDVGETLTAAPTALPTAIATDAPAPSVAVNPPATQTDDSTGECTSPDPASTTRDWPLLESVDGDFSLRYPPAWQDISGAVPLLIEVAFDRETQGESGQPEGVELQPGVARSADGGFVVVSRLEGISSSAATLHDRHMAKVETIGDVIHADELERCLDGEPAAGFASLNTDGSYVQSWFLSRGGVAYHVLGLDPADEDALDTLMQEILSTWEWTR